MSWKSLVSAGLLCVLASPAFATPSIDAVGGGTQANTSGYLDPNGNWVFQVRVATTNPVSGGTPLAAELGLVQSSARFPVGAPNNPANIVSATNNNSTPNVGWDTPNPGNPIFGWEVAGGSGFPEGVQPGAGANINQVFAATGSAIINTTAPQNYLLIQVDEPRTNSGTMNSTTTLTLDGAYDSTGAPVAAPGGDRARVAELLTATTSANYHFQGAVTFNAKAGDVNLTGNVTIADYGTLIGKYNMNPGGNFWYDGDFTGEGNVTIADYGLLIGNYGTPNYTVLTGSYTLVPPPGGGSGSAAVPEPASLALLALAALGLAGLRFRR